MLYDSTYLKFKNRKNRFLVFKVSVKATVRVLGGGHLFLDLGVVDMYSLFENSPSGSFVSGGYATIFILDLPGTTSFFSPSSPEVQCSTQSTDHKEGCDGPPDTWTRAWQGFLRCADPGGLHWRAAQVFSVAMTASGSSMYPGGSTQCLATASLQTPCWSGSPQEI